MAASERIPIQSRMPDLFLYMLYVFNYVKAFMCHAFIYSNCLCWSKEVAVPLGHKWCGLPTPRRGIQAQEIEQSRQVKSED